MIQFSKKSSALLSNKIFFITAIICVTIELVISLLYYTNHIHENGVTGILWIISIFFLILSVDRKNGTIDNSLDISSNKNESPRGRYVLSMICVITAVYFVTHLVGYSNAPWNNYGLFDDAAWDIYIARERCFKENVFEIIFWDEEIGCISRELLFHYYISILFNIFGYNMFVFNMGLVFLGYITVLFTSLLAERMTKNIGGGIAAGLILNFLPLHYTQVFMGHRYAICAPMMMISAYLIWRAFTEEKNSLFYAVIGGVFAGFTMESAIMGKQYIWGLIATAVFGLLFSLAKNCFIRNENQRKPILSFSQLILGIGIFSGYIVSCVPLYAYIWTHGNLYRIREMSLTQDFFTRLSEEGPSIIYENLRMLGETVFAPQSGLRQFSADYPILNWYMLVLLISGVLIALKKKWFLPLLMIAIPTAGNCITTCYDFRLLISAPFLSILVLLPIYSLLRLLSRKALVPSSSVGYCAIAISLVLMGSPIQYLWRLSHDPRGQYYLNHTDLAVCRYIQDVVNGQHAPNIDMKKDEFNPPAIVAPYDTYAATYTSYAHIHAFLEPYNAREILRLFDDFPYITTEEEVLRDSLKETILNYTITERDLMIVFEYNEKINEIMRIIERTGVVGIETDTFTMDGDVITMIQMKIHNKDLPEFKRQILKYM